MTISPIEIDGPDCAFIPRPELCRRWNPVAGISGEGTTGCRHRLTGPMGTHREVELMDQTDSCIRLRLRHAPEGPAADYFGVFEKVLSREGYAPKSILGQLRLVSSFSAWLRMKNIPLKELRQDCATLYLRYRYRSHHRCRRRHDRPVLLKCYRKYRSSRRTRLLRRQQPRDG